VVEPVSDAEPVVVVSSELDVSCTPERARHTTCALEARYELENRSGAQVEAHLAIFDRGYVPEVMLEAESGPVLAPTTLERGYGRLLRTKDDFELEEYFGEQSQARVLTVSFRAGERRKLVVRGSAQPGAFYQVFGPGCEQEGILERHPIMGHGTRRHTYGVDFFMAPGLHPDPASVLRVRVRRPRAWVVDMSHGGTELHPIARPDGDFLEESATATFLPGETLVSIGLTVERSRFFHGGPYVGIGWWFAPVPGPRLRVGYEVAAPAWLALSLGAESDFRKSLAFVPALEAMGNSWHTMYGVGVGVPTKLVPTPRAGGRAQASASYDAFVLRGVVDLYPGTSDRAHVLEGAVILQVAP
jgi:hypothetical protein